ncbi:hypothetical protein XENOCAPTIV_010821 [Xenoophorus captivus]|uniref:RRM domain-containing protein n=1 Tax=Xenoophorus captivus TaxID=1517983 RepID=A0ABV0Q9D5_9TELE
MRRLYVGGLNHTVTQKDLKDRFGKFGEVLDVELRTRRDDEVKNFTMKAAVPGSEVPGHKVGLSASSCSTLFEIKTAEMFLNMKTSLSFLSLDVWISVGFHQQSSPGSSCLH